MPGMVDSRSRSHGFWRSTCRDGRASVELAIRTTDGTKVADAIWCSAERWAQIEDAYDAPVAPEICVEVLSPTNTEAEMETKRALYFKAGSRGGVALHV